MANHPRFTPKEAKQIVKLYTRKTKALSMLAIASEYGASLDAVRRVISSLGPYGRPPYVADTSKPTTP